MVNFTTLKKIPNRGKKPLDLIVAIGLIFVNERTWYLEGKAVLWNAFSAKPEPGLENGNKPGP
ncbi:MAG: hypothetical protein LBF38_12780 [Deltaproteobacteria bacterium]|jgi:hypothetical protein|nr:hypothetical protein [Deltaproteobacteria bacterium]